MSPHPFLDHDGPIGFVHRGGAGEGTENTLATFVRAAALGFRYIETDVHATADGVLVAFHDATLDRLVGRPGTIADLPWADVSRIRLPDGAAIPRLVEVLDTLPDVRVNVDVKADQAVGPLVALLRDRPGWLDRVCVGSFSDARLLEVRRHLGAALCTSTGPAGVAAHRLAATWSRPTPTRYLGNCLQVPVRAGPVTVVTQRFVTRAHEAGLPVHVWTVDDPAEMDRLLDLGVDGLMSDRPEVLRTVLDRRGLWSSGPPSR